MLLYERSGVTSCWNISVWTEAANYQTDKPFQNHAASTASIQRMMSNILESSDLPACTHHHENMKIYLPDCHAHWCVPEDIFPHELSSHTILSSNYPLCAHNILNESSKLHTSMWFIFASPNYQYLNQCPNCSDGIVWQCLPNWYKITEEFIGRLQAYQHYGEDLMRLRLRIVPGHPHCLFTWNKKQVPPSKVTLNVDLTIFHNLFSREFCCAITM